MSIYLFEFLFILHFVYFQIGTIIFLFKTHEKKSKALEIILYDLNRNHYEIIAFVCFQMLFGVATRNVTTGGDEQVLRIIEGVKTVDADVSDEEGFGGSKEEDDLQALTMSEILVIPALVDNGKSRYIQREKRSTRPSIARIKVPKKKAKKIYSLLKTQDTEAEPRM